MDEMHVFKLVYKNLIYGDRESEMTFIYVKWKIAI